MGDVNELKTERSKTMENTLPTTIEYFDNLLGEQLTEGGGGGGDGFTKANVTVIGKAYTTFWGSDEERISGKPIYGLLEYNNHFYSQIYMTDEKIGDTTFHTWILETSDAMPAFQFVELAGENPISVSGNCTLQNVGKGGYVVTFTGDCTITIS